MFMIYSRKTKYYKNFGGFAVWLKELFDPFADRMKSKSLELNLRLSDHIRSKCTFKMIPTISAGSFVYYIVFPILLFIYNPAIADTFFVRPSNNQINYGKEDGSSYSNAWNGLENIIWGDEGVDAGDNLYVCGTHVAVVGENHVFGNVFMPRANGRPGSWITIRGDCPKDPGRIWGAYKDMRQKGMQEKGWREVNDGVFYNECGAWHKVFTSHGLFENISGESYQRYKRLASAQEVVDSSENGVFFAQIGIQNRGAIWIKPFNVSSFNINVRYSGVLGYQLMLSPKFGYIEFRDLGFYGNHILQENIRTDDNGFTLNHYRFTRCRFISHVEQEPYLYAPINAQNVTFEGCEFAFAPNGIYIIWANGDNRQITIRDCHFHDIGKIYISAGQSADGHAIGIQNNEYFWIVGNTFERCGSAIVCHIGKNNTQKHIYILRNTIRDMRKMLAPEFIAPGVGIQIEGSNDVPKGNSGDIIIAYNTVTDCETNGIATTRKDTVRIFNNLCARNENNYVIAGLRPDGASVEFKNNISYKPIKKHMIFVQRHSDIRYFFDANNNLYFSKNEQDFRFGVTGIDSSTNTDFISWKNCHNQAIAQGRNTHPYPIEQNELIVEPIFIDFQGGDFRPAPGSPVIDAGVLVDIDSELHEYMVPYGKSVDIGPFEYQNSNQKLQGVRNLRCLDCEVQ